MVLNARDMKPTQAVLSRVGMPATPPPPEPKGKDKKNSKKGKK